MVRCASWVVLAGVSVALAACGGDDSSVANLPDATVHVLVMDGGPSASATPYASQSAAVKEASRLAGFNVLPVRNLPAGADVTFIAHTQGPKAVEVFVKSDTGGADVIEMLGRQPPAGATRVQTDGSGEYYRSASAGRRAYTLVSDDMTFGLQTDDPGGMNEDLALKVLRGFE